MQQSPTIGGNAMKWVYSKFGSLALIGLSVLGSQLAGQVKNESALLKHPTRYRVIDTGSFGGPNSHMSLGTQILNNRGVFTGFADTDIPDPYAPGGCWDGDCLVARTSRWESGKLSDLGSLDGGPNSESNWINENGQIAGDSQNGLLDPFGGWQIHGVLWKQGQVIDIGTIRGGYDSLARAVNNSGVVVGLSTTLVSDPFSMIMSFGLPFAFQTRAYRWQNGVLRDLGTLGGPDAMALGINDRGQIAGNSYIDFASSPGCGTLTTGAFLWENGKMRNLGSLGGTCTQVPLTTTPINNHGQVIGFSFLSGDQVFHPFLWEEGHLADLGTLGGNFGYAVSLNQSGDVVGWQTRPGDDNVIHATLWSAGNITDLGALGPGQCSTPFAINGRKQVVGTSGACDFNDPSLRAFIWEPGRRMTDLNTLISPKLGLQLRNVATINERGEMAVVAFFPNGDHRPVLLIPCTDRDQENEECNEVSSSIIPPTSLSSSSRARVANEDSPQSQLRLALGPWFHLRSVGIATK
jgi:probable HAF family extracellular repeat protein